jgi:geranylgeranyl diphosphate synthase type I
MRQDLAAVAAMTYDAVLTLSPALRDAATYHFNWPPQPRTAELPSSETLSLPGKGMRAQLCLLSAALVGGQRSAAVPYAASIELTHNFTLVFDDFMDQDTVRRGRPAVWVRFGPNVAMLLGVELYAIAIELLAQLGSEASVRRLVAAGHSLSGGQYEDLDMVSAAESAPVSTERWTAMAEGKTGALFGCAMALGGLAGGADITTVSKLDRAGRCVGVAFQIVDDLLRVWGDEVQLGKPVVSHGTANLYPPLAAMLTHADAHQPSERPDIRVALAATRPSVESLLGKALSLLADVCVDREAITEIVSLVVDSASRIR